MRVAVLGAGGMLGWDLRLELENRHEVTAWRRDEADVTDLQAMRTAVRLIRPDVIINCAAATNVDRCETEPDWAYRTNAWGAWAPAVAAADVGAFLVHISTDFVFSGELGRAYREWDAVGPISVYGASKLAGETAVWNSGCRAAVVRTQWLFGVRGKSFAHAILRAASARPAEGLRVVRDQVGAPTYTGHLARKLGWLTREQIPGIFHINNAGECSRADWAAAILRGGGFGEVAVHPIDSSEWPTPARRPARSTLRRYALELMGQDDMPPWEEGLEEFLRRRSE